MWNINYELRFDFLDNYYDEGKWNINYELRFDFLDNYDEGKYNNGYNSFIMESGKRPLRTGLADTWLVPD